MQPFGLDFFGNIGLGLLEALILVSLAIVMTCFFAGIGGLIRYTTRPAGSMVSVYWLVRLGIFTGVPFSIIGICSGYLTGLSRVGAISALVPAGLTLVGGVAVYLFSKGGKAAVLAAFAVVDFSVLMVIGALIGGREREQAESSLDRKLDELKIEFVLQQYRHSLGMKAVGSVRKTPDNDQTDTNSE
jgi:hypothetical protein